MVRVTKRLLALGFLSSAMFPPGCAVPVDEDMTAQVGSREEGLDFGDPVLDPSPGVLAPGAPAALPGATPCGDAKRIEVLDPATDGNDEVIVNCSLTLPSAAIVTKRIVMSGSTASGATLDCNGAMIDATASYDPIVIVRNWDAWMLNIRSEMNPDGTPSNPTDVTVRSCRIKGSVLIGGGGMTKASYNTSSRSSGHVARARNAAPTRITIDNTRITGTQNNQNDLLYFGAGVTSSKFIHSVIDGYATGVPVYVDAETSQITLAANRFLATTDDREVIAIDSSDRNTIVNNYFSGLNNGGIYLYRNCGEKGTVRHTTPSYNTIVNNVFYYDAYTGSNPAVYIGSRNGSPGYCDEDTGYGVGSSELTKYGPESERIENKDHAKYNVVMQNQIYKRSVSDMIRVRDAMSSPNYINYNTTVTTHVDRAAGCYVANGYTTDFILHRQSIDMFRSSTNGAPICTGLSYTCYDGTLTASSAPTCAISKITFGCQATDNNAGCQTTAYCPSGTRIIGAVGACNLEYGAVSASTVDQVPTNWLSVVRPSDNVSDGRCLVGVSPVSSGIVPLVIPYGASSTSAWCYERDSNGGDCHVRGALYCR